MGPKEGLIQRIFTNIQLFAVEISKYDNQHIVTATSITSSMTLLQPELIPKEYKKHTELHEDHLLEVLKISGCVSILICNHLILHV